MACGIAAVYGPFRLVLRSWPCRHDFHWRRAPKCFLVRISYNVLLLCTHKARRHRAIEELKARGYVKGGQQVAIVQSGRQPIWRSASTHAIQVSIIVCKPCQEKCHRLTHTQTAGRPQYDIAAYWCCLDCGRTQFGVLEGGRGHRYVRVCMCMLHYICVLVCKHCKLEQTRLRCG